MSQVGQVKTGRIDARRYCEGCGNRIKYGQPKAMDTWIHRLRLTKEQHNLLLVAAAEFMEIEGGNGRPGSQATRQSSPFPLPRMRA